MIRIRSGRGLGDSIYLRPIAEYLVAQGHRVTVLSNYADVFIGAGVMVEPFTRVGHSIVAHYTHSMADQSLTQFASMLRTAKLPPSVPLRFAWNIQNAELIDGLRKAAAGRPVITVHGGHMPMQRGDAWTKDLIPRKEAFDAVLGALDGCYKVRIGNAENFYALPCDVEMNGGTSVADLLDIVKSCAVVVAQCSFAVPLAEVFGKPLLAVWAAKGLTSATPYLRHVTFEKVVERPQRARLVRDDWHANIIHDEARRWIAAATQPEELCAL